MKNFRESWAPGNRDSREWTHYCVAISNCDYVSVCSYQFFSVLYVVIFCVTTMFYRSIKTEQELHTAVQRFNLLLNCLFTKVKSTFH